MYTEELAHEDSDDEEMLFEKEVLQGDDDLYLMHHLLTEVFRD